MLWTYCGHNVDIIWAYCEQDKQNKQETQDKQDSDDNQDKQDKPG